MNTGQQTKILYANESENEIKFYYKINTTKRLEFSICRLSSLRKQKHQLSNGCREYERRTNMNDCELGIVIDKLLTESE